MEYHYTKVTGSIYEGRDFEDGDTIHNLITIELMDDYHKALILIGVNGMVDYIDGYRMKYENTFYSSANSDDNLGAIDVDVSNHLRKLTHTLVLWLSEMFPTDVLINLIDFHSSPENQSIQEIGSGVPPSIHEELQKLSTEFIDEMTSKYDL